MRKVNPESLKSELLEAGVLDTDYHSVFAGGRHGQKLHFDRVVVGSVLYKRMIRAKAQLIRETIPPKTKNMVVVGIAEGTNQAALDLADYIGGKVIGVQSRKTGRRQVSLNQMAKRIILATKPELIVLDEDVGTEGTVCAGLVPEIKSIGVDEVIAFHTWQRQPHLPKLDAAKVPYYPVIHENLPTYSPVHCRAEGFCADQIELFAHGEER